MKKFNLFKMLAVLIVLITSINTAWGWGSSDGTVVYFDKQNVPTLFTTPYLRVGRSNYNEYKTMSLVAGTKYLYSYSLGKWDNYDAISVANNYGWTGGNTIYQPKADQFENSDASKPKEGYKSYQITQQTNYYEKSISGNFYIQPTTAANLDWACQYYNHNNGTLPTYSITYNSPSNGTLTVQRYTGSTYTSLASGTTGLKPTQIIKITTSPNTHYGRASLTVTGATQIDGGDTYYITANCTINVTFDHKWTIKGGNSNTAGDGSDAMGDWSTYNNLSYTGTANTYRGTITLAANTTYRFKVVDRDNGTDAYYGYGGSDAYHLSFVGQSTASSALNTNSDNKENLALMSAGAGTYTFTWNSSSKTLTVDYPTVTHPSTDYIYYKDYDNYDSHGDIVTHVWGGSTASTGDQRMPVVNSFNFDGTTYFYAALGNNTKAIFAGSDNTASYKTEDLNSASSKKGQYYDKNSNSSESTRWQPFTATLTLDHQAATNTPAPNSITVTYGANTNLTGDIITTTPTKEGYNFGGYYTQQGGGGDQFMATNENVNINVPNYTDGSKNWIKTGSTVSTTIYAKWTQEVTLNKHNDESNGSVTMTYNSGSHEAITTPEKTGYTFTGWYAAADGNALVIATDGTLQNSTSYTDASGKWTNSGEAPTLHAHWMAKTYTVTLDGNGATGAGTANVTATYNSSTLAAITNPSRWGNVFGGWEDEGGALVIGTDGKLIASVTGYTDGSKNWTHDGIVTLYAKWTVDESKTYTVTDGTTPTSFVKVADGIYRATRTMAKDNTVYLSDGTTAAGPTVGGNYEFEDPSGSSSLGTNSDKFKYTGTSDQTIVYKLNLNNLTLSIGHVVFYLGDKDDDDHKDVTDYDGYHADLASGISGTFEYRLRVNSCTEWSTLYLPFSPTEVTVWGGTTNHHLFPYYYSDKLYQGYYVLRTPTTTDLEIEKFDQWFDPSTYNALPNANTPYIVQWRNSYLYHKYISIWGSGMTEPSFAAGTKPTTEGIARICGNGSLTSRDVQGAYVLESDYGGGAWLRPEEPDADNSVGPFQCYILTAKNTALNHRVLRHTTGENTATGWEDVLNSERKAQVVVYTITGLRVTEYNDCSFDEAGRRLSETYNEGIFIMRAGDESVKLMLR